MMRFTLLLLTLSFLHPQAFAVNNAVELYLQKRMALMQREREKSMHPHDARFSAMNNDVESKYPQKLDHFNKTDTQTFQQRYFTNTQYASGKNAPVIYVICGEGTCSGASDMPPITALAQKMGANLIALEHRYYGYSQPFPLLTAENMKFLSMDQALEDLAQFQRYAQSTLGFTGKWVSVGGSYPGALSAFYRLKHPELISGSLASSGPVLAKADFWEYDRHVARVAGATCLSAIKAVVADTESRLADPSKVAGIKALFQSSDVKDDVDFLYVLADMAATAIQYGYQKPFCDEITGAVSLPASASQDASISAATRAYADVGVRLFQAFGMTPLQDSFQGAESLNPDDYLGFAGMRAWMYQSCTEFGFYQTANPNEAESSRSQRISLPYHNQVCNRLFGLTTPVSDTATNANYYNKLFDASVTNIFFTNGANDPWSNLSITTTNPGPSVNSALTLMTIDGASHCDDLGERASAALAQAREEFQTLAQAWTK